MSRKIAVTGANGFLGSRVAAYYQERYETIGYTRQELDFTDREKAKKVIKRDHPDILIHTGAISDTSACEENPQLSWKVNVEGVSNLASVCGELGIRLIFCSSDQVYMGNQVRTPHRENEKLCPVSAYACQKRKAEQEALRLQPDTVALRLSWMFSADRREGKEHGTLFSSIRDAIQNGCEIRYPVHDYRSITDVWEVVRNMEIMFQAPAGIYNFGSENDLSTYEVVKRVLAHIGKGQNLLKKNEEAFAGDPRNLRMDIEKCRAAGAVFRTTAEALEAAGEMMFITNPLL